LVRGNPVGGEATERGVDPEDLIERSQKRIAERFGAAPARAQWRAIVWRAMSFNPMN